MTAHTAAAVHCPACGTDTTTSRCPTCTAWIIPLGPLDKILTANLERTKHWTYRARITKTWRDGTNVICRTQKIPAMQRAVIHIAWNPPDKGRRDAANSYPTCKAIVDGIVDAGVIPDDNSRHCDGPYMHMGTNTKPASMTVAIIPIEAP